MSEISLLADGFLEARPIDIKTAEIEDFIADLRKPYTVGNSPRVRSLTAASINRNIELRQMLNWAVGREYLDKTPFRRGTETLIKRLREDRHTAGTGSS